MLSAASRHSSSVLILSERDGQSVTPKGGKKVKTSLSLQAPWRNLAVRPWCTAQLFSCELSVSADEPRVQRQSASTRHPSARVAPTEDAIAIGDAEKADVVSAAACRGGLWFSKWISST
eukprot:25292-Rhodomonas_salina.1